MAGTTDSDHSLRSRDIGEAVCSIKWTPGGVLLWLVRREGR